MKHEFYRYFTNGIMFELLKKNSKFVVFCTYYATVQECNCGFRYNHVHVCVFAV